MNLGKSIKTFRKSLQPKVSQRDYAKSIGITQSYLSHIEAGNKEPSTSLLKIIADRHNTPMSVFLWFSTEEQDISPSKLDSFKILKPSIDALLMEFFVDKTEEVK